MGLVQGHGINDMPYGWASESEENKRIYQTWHNMLVRCYDEKYHKRKPTYKRCSVCQRWLLLSNFVEDFKLIDGYDEEKFLSGELQLDKDIKSNGINKEYCLCQCLLISISENVRQSRKTTDYTQLQGENNPQSIKIVQYDKQENFVRVWDSAHDIQRELGIPNSNIIQCCKFWDINCNKEEWLKTNKRNPRKTVGGFIFKYYNKKEKEEK